MRKPIFNIWDIINSLRFYLEYKYLFITDIPEIKELFENTRQAYLGLSQIMTRYFDENSKQWIIKIDWVDDV